MSSHVPYDVESQMCSAAISPAPRVIASAQLEGRCPDKRMSANGSWS